MACSTAGELLTPNRDAAPVCVCNTDLDGDGLADLTDVWIVTQCFPPVSPSTCPGEAAADLNCDGAVNQADADIALCDFRDRDGTANCCG